MPELDEHNRPVLFYGRNIHENCQNFSHYSEGNLAEKLSDDGCLIELGCKGPLANADCFERHWNNGVNWCIGAKSPCIGCCEPDFPDEVAPFYAKLPEEMLPTRGTVTAKSEVEAVSRA
jgi:hydrogenase small subunit